LVVCAAAKGAELDSRPSFTASSEVTPQHAFVYADMATEANPWISDEELSDRGGVIVWQLDDNNKTPPDGWLERFPEGELLEPFELTSQAISGPRELKVGAFLVPPAKE